MLMLLMMIVY